MANNQKVQLIAAYNPPSEHLLQEDLDKIFISNETKILNRDLNATHTHWNSITNFRDKSLMSHTVKGLNIK